LTRAPVRYAILLVGVAGLSMAGVFYKLAAAPIIVIVAYRMLFAAALSVPLAGASRALSGINAKSRSRLSTADVRASLLSGVFFAVDVLAWAMSLKFTSVASAGLFVSTDPIFVSLLAWIFLRERPSSLMGFGIAIGVVGLTVVGGHDLHVAGRALVGDAIACFAALCESAYLLVGRHVRRRVDAPRYTLVLYSASTVVLWIAVVAGHWAIAISRQDLFIALALAVVVTLLGHTLVSQSLGATPASAVAASFMAQPMLAALFALWFIHQPILLPTVIGGLIALAGVGIVVLASERRSMLALATN